MFSCLQILEAFLWFVLITLLNVTLIILTLSVSRLLNLLVRLVAFRLFLNPQCLASISRWITASSSWNRFCRFVCRALSSIMVICMLTAIRLLFFFFNDTATTEIYTLSLQRRSSDLLAQPAGPEMCVVAATDVTVLDLVATGDRKSTRLNSSHVKISYAVFCLKKKKKTNFQILFYKKKKNKYK